jgi:hypothetical protein
MTLASRDWLGTSVTPMPPIPTRSGDRALPHRTSWARPRRRRADSRSVRAMRKRATSESEARLSSRNGRAGPEHGRARSRLNASVSLDDSHVLV